MNLSAIDIAEKAGLISPKWLISREFGLQFLPKLEQELDKLSINDVLYLNMLDISLLEWSFADEVFGTLSVKLGNGDFPSKYLVLENLSEVSKENLDIALRTRPEREGKQIRNLGLPVRQNGEIVFVGKMEEHLKPVWAYILSHSQVTAREIAEHLELEVNIASTKLKTLFDIRLLKRLEYRSEVGKQYIYTQI